jgi:hypothetical protein
MTVISSEQTRMWLVLTFGEERSYAGNVGYDDVPSKWYSYDSFVANHLQVAVGHWVILCDRAKALGVARIDKIDAESSTRVLQRCPVCRKTGIKRRKKRQPEYRCNDGHEFVTPIQENADCTKYTAHFGTTFTPFSEEFGREFLRQGCPRYSDQLAMQEFDFSSMEAMFLNRYSESARLISRLTRNS